MILPEVRLVTWANLKLTHSGLDSPDLCRNSHLFANWPEPIEYCYNSRGFRDLEWPADLSSAVWCIGDSFTVGLGVNFHQTWCQHLQRLCGRPVINVSMDGASNDWIARQACAIIQQAKPQHVVCHWSYSHRTELPLEHILVPIWQEYYNAVRDASWPDCASPDQVSLLPLSVQQSLSQDPRFDCWYSDFDLDSLRRQHYNQDKTVTSAQDLARSMDCISRVDLLHSAVVHSFIPNWHPEPLPFEPSWLAPIMQIDLARDGFHYGPQTQQLLAQRVLEVLEI